MKKALIVLAEGFEEVEAITPIDILNRAGIKVTIAGIKHDIIKGAHGIPVKTDIILGNEQEDLPDALILPGGSPGAENLANSIPVKDIVANMNDKGRIIAAICAAPALVLAPTGILDGRKATCFPGLEKNFSTKVKFLEEKVVQDGNIITSRGAGTAFLFGLKILENLLGRDTSDMIAEQMLYT